MIIHNSITLGHIYNVFQKLIITVPKTEHLPKN